MTLEQLERRIVDLERQVAELHRERISPIRGDNASETFGMMGDDPEFDEIVRFGREYRLEANQEGG